MLSINPRKWFSGQKAPQGATVTVREAQGQGPWTDVLNDYVAREVAPALYEALREAIPVIDAAINRMVTLDGIIRVGGDNEQLVKKIRSWMKTVRVNDMQQGFQAFYAGMGNELYEQGCSIGEPVLGDGRQGVVKLNVADSKGVLFRRTDEGLETWYRAPSVRTGRGDGTDQVERVLRNNYQGASLLSALNDYGYIKIDSSRLVYAGLHNEANNPYGVSLMRSMEFVSKVLLTMDNATMHTWERFGDPVYKVLYKTKRKQSPEVLEARRRVIADNMSDAMAAKRQGKAVDFINAVGSDDDLVVEIIGADGNVLEIEEPARHVLEQLVAKTGLPPWILGYVWGTAERLALKQAELLLQESKTRFELRQPGLENVVALHLRAQGETWEEGDWHLEQELPNMQDVVAQAQADFLIAQTELMRSNAGDVEVGPVEMDETGKVVKIGGVRLGKSKTRTKAPGDGESFAEPDAALPAIEAETVAGMLSAWRTLEADVLDVLGLADAGKATKAPVFAFDANVALQDLIELENDFVAAMAAEDSDYIRGLYRTWLRGVLNAASEFDDVDAITDGVREGMSEALAREALEQVRDTTVRSFSEDIIRDLEAGVYDGLNPKDVARKLRNRFEIHNYDWERLARSELTDAHARGKMDQYAAHEVEQYDYVTAGDSKVSSICLANAAGGPYARGAGPLPMRDSHPNCRCTVRAYVGDGGA